MSTSIGGDVFADIAAQRQEFRDESLVVPEPVVSDPPTLPPMEKDADIPFKSARKIRTEEQLNQELKRLRRYYAPYEENYAPAISDKRVRTDIETFDWRCETVEDRADFERVLKGQGQWERVNIPHYGPPLGREVTYYRTEVEVTQDMLDKGALFLCFKGVDYIAHVFLNNAYVGSHEGFFAPFEFDITSVACKGKNSLVVKAENDAVMKGNKSWEEQFREGDKLYAATGLGYDDPETGWHHCPPGMGIYQGVYLEARPRLHISDIFVRPQLEEGLAEVWVEVFNCDTDLTDGSVGIDIYGQNFEREVKTDFPGIFPDIGPGSNTLRISVPLPNPRKWTPQSPWLYQAQVTLYPDKNERQKAVDVRSRSFGMRSFEMDESGQRKGQFSLNGDPVKLRGANTMGHLQQCVYKGDWEQLRDDILLCKACNMNFLRLTQRPVQPEIYEFCDRLGMMAQTDLPLFGVLRRNQFCEAVKQTEEMERLVRPYPCNIMVSYINEPFPNAKGRTHRHLTRPELESFFTAANQAVRLANPDRVIKPVDGDYDPPAEGLPDNHCYCGWYNGHGVDIGRLNAGYWQRVKPGWYYGCGEFGAEGLDPVDLMRRRYPAEWLPQTEEEEKEWSPDSIIRAQSGRFCYLWFDEQDTLEDWVKETRAHQERVVRLMTEAFRRDPRMNTFAIHLSIDAFPSGWMKTIMDCERRPKPAYFAYRDVLTPLMVSLRTDRFRYFAGDEATVETWICNDNNSVPEGYELRYRLEKGKEVLGTAKTEVKVKSATSECQGIIRFKMPKVSQRATVKLRTALVDADGKTVHDTEQCLEVFPAGKTTSTSRSLKLLASRHGEGQKLSNSLGIKPGGGKLDGNDVVLVDNYEDFEKNRADVERAVTEDGATLLFISLPEGEYDIADSIVTVKRCGMKPRHFASRRTGHPIVKGFRPHDFRLWHDAEKGIVTPFLYSTFKAEGWEPVLTSGDGAFGPGKWDKTLAAAEKQWGNGVVRICQVELHNRVTVNPIAREFARRMLTADRH